MDFDTFVAVASLVLAVAGYIAYRYLSENVYLKCKKGAKK